MILLMYEHTITASQATMLIIFGLVTLIAFLLRDVPGLGKAWYLIKIFLIVVLGTLMANYLKKELKDWWNK